MVEVKILPESTTIGKVIKELSLPPESELCLLIRKEEKPRVPTDDVVLQSGDQLIAVTSPESEEALRTALSGI